MGLLDDAIRQHLELKRRHGADPAELARQEHEALGPVRRQPIDRESHEPGLGPAGDVDSLRYARETHPGEAEYEDYYEEEYDGDEEAAEWEDPFAEDEDESSRAPGSRLSVREGRGSTAPPREDEPPEQDTEPGVRRWKRSRRGRVPPEQAPPTQAEPPESPEVAAGGEETVEYDVGDEASRSPRRPHESQQASEPVTEDQGDVLEETPDFLQDAPEHDRLWFEQRPPRDFDFDE